MADKGQEVARAKSPTRPISEQIHARIQEKFGSLVTLVDAVDPFTVVQDAARVVEVMRFLKENSALRFDFLRSVTGVDYPEQNQIASVYHLYSYEKSHGHCVKFLCDRASPEVPTVEGLWPTANWFEREAFDLLGIIYVGHSDLRRIMLPDDWIGHPLRRDYVEAESYHGIGTTRASPLDAYKQMDDARRKARDERGIALAAPTSSPIKPPDDWIPPKKKGSSDAEESEKETEE